MVIIQNGGTFHEEEIGELLAKNTARTVRRQLDGRHLLFGEYLQTEQPLSPKPANKHALSKMNVTCKEVSASMDCFSLFSNYELFWMNN